MLALIYSAFTSLGISESAERIKHSSDFISSIYPMDNFTNMCDKVPQGSVYLPKDDSLHEGLIEWWFSFGHLEDKHGRKIDYVYVVPKFFTSSIPFLIAESGIFIDDKLEYEITTHFTQPQKVENGFKFDLGHVKLEGGDGHEIVHLKAGDYKLDLEVTQIKAPIF